MSIGTGTNNMVNIGGDGNSTLTIDVADVTSSAAADLTVQNVLKNSPNGNSLTKTGAGTLVLSSANTYSGSTTIAAGVLALSGSGDLVTTGTVAVTGSGAAFDISGATGIRTLGMLTGSAGSAVALGANSLSFGNATSGTFAGSIGGTGGLTKQGAGAVSLSGSSSYSGPTTLSAGQLNLNNSSAIGTGTFTIAGGTFDNTSGGAITLTTNNAQAWNSDFAFAGSSALNLGTGAVTLGATRQVTVTSSTLTVGGAIGGGSFGLTKAGVGTLLLTGSSTFTGLVSINAGVLGLSGAGSLSGSNSITIGNGGTFDLGGASQTTAGTVILSAGSTLRSGTLTSNNALQAASNQYTGSLTLGAGGAFVTNQRLLLQNGNGSNSLTIAAGSTGSMVFGGDSSNNMNYVAISGTATFTVNGGTVNFTNGSTGTGNGYLNVGSNGDTSNGSVVVNGGNMNVGTWLKLGGNFNNGNATNARSSLSVTSGTVTVGGGSISSDNGVLFMNGSPSDAASTKITGTSTLALNAGGVLAVSQIQTGNYGTDTITFDGGTLRARASSTSFLAAAAPLTVNVNAGGATIDTQGFAITIGAAFQNGGGGGGLTVSGSGGGGLTLTNAATYTGATTINNGAGLSVGNGVTDGSIATSSNVVNNGSLTINRIAGSTAVNAITGTGSVTKSGAGSLAISQASSIGGSLTLNAGTLDLGGATSSIGRGLIVNGGTLQNGTLNLTGSAGTHNVSVNIGSDSTISANLASGSVGLDKYGAGALLLTGTSSFANNAQNAQFNVGGGTLRIGSGGAVSSASRLLVQGGILQIDAGAGAVSFGGDASATSNFVGVDSQGGTLTMTGGALSFNTSNASNAGYLRIGANGTSGSPNSSSMTVSSGTVNVGHSASIGARYDNGNAAAHNNGTLSILGGVFTIGTGSDTATANGVNGALYLKNDAVGTSGSATLTLTGGTLSLKQIIGGLQGTSTVNLNGGTLQARVGSANFLDAAAGLTVNVQGGGAAIDTQAFAVTIGAALGNGGGGGGLTKLGSGTLTFAGSNTYTGTTSVNAGTLALATGGSFANSSSIIVGDVGSTGAVLDLTAKTEAFSIGAGQLLGGGGTARLASSGTLNVLGTFSPGNSPGLFTYEAGTTVLSGTTLMEIFGVGRATTPSHGTGFYDAVDVVDNGILQFGGELTLDFSSLYADSTTFDLFTPATGSSLAGNFAGVNVTGGFYTGLSWSQTGSTWKSSSTAGGQSLEFNATTGQLVIVPEPGAIALAVIGVIVAAWASRGRR
jgi:autotransporter-associated beta strand protein